MDKNKSKQSEKQTEKARFLFELYPNIEKAYQLCQDLRNVFENIIDKIYDLSKLAQWHKKVAQAELKSFNTISRSIKNHYQTIVTFLDNRSTNASAEPFNNKIKIFRFQFRGMRNKGFFFLD